MINIQKNKEDKTSIYDTISNDKRLKLIEMVSNNYSLKDSAKILDMNYSTAKTIFRVYKKEKRIMRKYPTKFDNKKDAYRKRELGRMIALKEFMILSIERQNLNYTINKYNKILSILSNLICKLSLMQSGL